MKCNACFDHHSGDNRSPSANSAMLLCLLAVGTALGAMPHRAGAQAIVGFDINSVDANPLFSFDNQGTENPNDDVLSAASSTVDFTVHFDSDELMFDDATFLFHADLMDLTSGTVGLTTVYEMLLDGSFSFAESLSGDTILSATFSGARLLLLDFGDSGFVGHASGVGASDAVNFIAGPALSPHFVLDGPQEFEFTVTGLADPLGGPVDIHEVLASGDTQFEDFAFNSSFSGSLVLAAEPGSLLIALTAIVWMCAYRWPKNEWSAQLT